jgi:ATP:ADP antiporter, AAA family
MKQHLVRALKIEPEDLQRGLLLSTSLFLVITSYVTGKVARDALFLAHFKAVQLPYADIASGVLAGFVVSGYLRIGRRLSLRDLLVSSQLFFSANAAIFWIVIHYYHPIWLLPVFYFWVGIVGVLAPTQVWTLANYLLTTREAKRIFGMVGGGGILGWVCAGFISKTTAKLLGTESLILAMVPFLAGSAVLTYIVWQTGQMSSADSHHAPAPAPASGTRQKDVQGTIRLIFSSPYLAAIATVILVSSFTTTLTGWQFKAIAKDSFGHGDALAVFFGDFYFYTGILALTFQFLLTTRLLRRFGLSIMLFILPVSVLIGSGALLIWGSIAAAIFLKGSDQILRYSLDRSSVELLYLPLSPRIKLQAKWFIDTVIWRFGDGLAGVVTLLFATYLHWSPERLSSIAILLLLGWLAAVFVSGRQYVATLKQSLVEHRLTAEQTSSVELDRSTSEILASQMQASDPKEILYALSLFESARNPIIPPGIRALLGHPAPEVRQKALSILSAAGDKSICPQVERLLKDPSPDVRTEAMFYLTQHAHIDPLSVLEELNDFEDFSLRSAVAAFLARPGKTQDLETAQRIFETMVEDPNDKSQRAREEVARLLGTLPDAFVPLLSRLLTDPSPLVVDQAIRSAGQMKDSSFVPLLLNYLWHKDHAAEAIQALAHYGDAVVPQLNEMLGSDDTPLEIRREIPAVVAAIGSESAAKALGDHLLEGDSSLRFKIIGALNKLRRQHPEMELDTQMLELLLDAEIFGHYRSYQIIEAVDFPEESKQVVAPALKESLDQELERIFRLLNLLYPQLDFHSVYMGLQSQNKTVHDNALEFLESSLKSQLRFILVPLLDGKVSSKERAVLAARVVHTTVETREQGVAAMISSEDPWVKSCGVYAIGSFGIQSLSAELERCFEHPDLLLREAARAAKLRLAEQR